MKAFTKATISSVKVNDVYENTMTAEIDSANSFIWLTTKHINTVKNINEQQSIAISFEQLAQLNKVISEVQA